MFSLILTLTTLYLILFSRNTSYSNHTNESVFGPFRSWKKQVKTCLVSVLNTNHKFDLHLKESWVLSLVSGEKYFLYHFYMLYWLTLVQIFSNKLCKYCQFRATHFSDVIWNNLYEMFTKESGPMRSFNIINMPSNTGPFTTSVR